MIRLAKIAAVLVAVLAGGAMLGAGWLLRTATGRAWVRGVAERQATTLFDGRATLTVRAVRALSPTAVTLEGVELRDRWRQRVLRVGEVQATVDLGALTRRVVRLRRLALRDVDLALVQRLDSVWNVASLLADSVPARRGPPGWGDDVRVDSLTVDGATVTVAALWAPHRTFVGRERDSVVAAYRALHTVRDTAGQYVVVRRFAALAARLTDARLVRPGGGGRVRLAQLATRMSDPALPVHEATGTLEWSPAKQLRVDLARVTLGQSRGTVTGTIGWRDPGSVRYDLRVPVDTLALADIGWVWPALPPTGGGRLALTVRSAQDADLVDYTLDALAIRSEGADVSGRVTVRVTPRDLILSRLRLAFSPLTAAVWQRLLDAPPPPALDGAIRGVVVAERGGPLTAVVVDSARLAYEDGRHPAATVEFAGTVGSGVGVTAQALRLRRLELPLDVVRPLVTAWPTGLAGTLRAQGTVSADVAKGRLDWRDLSLSLRGPDGGGGTITGRVRAELPTTGDGALDLALATDGFDVRAAGAVADALPWRAPLVGSVDARGTLADAAVRLTLGARRDTVPLALDGRIRHAGRTWSAVGLLRMAQLDLRGVSGVDGLPHTGLDGALAVSATADAAPDGWRLDRAEVTGTVTQDSLDRRVPLAVEIDAVLDPERLDVRAFDVALAGGRAGGTGRLPRTRPAAGAAASGEGDSVVIVGRIDQLASLTDQLRQLGAAWPAADSVGAALRALPTGLAGTLGVELAVHGSLDAPAAQLRVDGKSLAAGGTRVDTLQLRGLLAWPLAGHVETTLRGVTAGPLRVDRLSLRADSVRPDGARLRLDAVGGDAPAIRASAVFSRTADTLRLRLDTLGVANGAARLALTGVATVQRTPAGVALDSLRIAVGDAGRLTLRATLPERGPVAGRLVATDLPLAGLSGLVAGGAGLRGTLDADVALAGTRDAPTLDWTVRADSIGRGRIAVAHVEGDGGYEARELFGTVLVDARRPSDATTALPRPALRGSLAVPLDLALRARATRLLDRPLAARVDIDSLALADLPVDLESAGRLGGMADGHLVVRGTARAPTVAGALRVRGGRVAVPAGGLELREVALDVRGAGREVVLERLRLTSGNAPGDSLFARGRLRLADGAGDRGAITLSAMLRRLAVVHRADLADIDLGGTIDVTGPLDSVAVTADLAVERGTIYRDAVQARQALDLTSPRALELLGRDAPAVAEATGLDLAALRGRLRSSRIRIAAGEELWVRAPSVAAKVGGEVTLVVDRGVLVPTGELTAQRGLYRLDLGVVRRTFDVDSGRVRFYGAEQLPPSIDVRASHVVRQASGGEVTVRAHIAGTLERPTLELSTDDAIGGAVPETEVISLLLFGAPTFALDGTSRSTVQSVTNVLLPSVGGVVEGALGRLLPVFNTVQLTTAGGTDQSLARVDLLSNLAVSAGKQIGDRTFLRLNSGICRGTADASRDLTPWLGLAVEYRLSPTLSMQASADPGAAPCSRAGADQVARLQFGFDLFHSWVF